MHDLTSLRSQIMTTLPPITPETPLGHAICKLFARALPLLEGKPSGSLKVFIFGGAAIHLLTKSRGSADIDAETVATRALNLDEIRAVFEVPETYEDESGRDLQVIIDQNYSNTLGPLHEDYRERAIPIQGFTDGSPLQLFIASPIDLAISKLGRFSEVDRSDIELLLRLGKIDVRKLLTLAEDAIDFSVIGSKGITRLNLRDVTEKYL
mgnify:CR=1 FL=1